MYYFLNDYFQKPILIQTLPTQTRRKKRTTNQTKETTFWTSVHFPKLALLFFCLSPSRPAELSLLPSAGVCVQTPSTSGAAAPRDLSQDAPDPHSKHQDGSKYLLMQERTDDNKHVICASNIYFNI